MVWPCLSPSLSSPVHRHPCTLLFQFLRPTYPLPSQGLCICSSLCLGHPCLANCYLYFRLQLTQLFSGKPPLTTQSKLFLHINLSCTHNSFSSFHLSLIVHIYLHILFSISLSLDRKLGMQKSYLTYSLCPAPNTVLGDWELSRFSSDGCILVIMLMEGRHSFLVLLRSREMGERELSHLLLFLAPSELLRLLHLVYLIPQALRAKWGIAS